MNLRRLAEEHRKKPGPETLIQLLRGSQGLVYTLCWRLLRHPQDSEDAAQQVLLELIDELPRLRDAEHVERWLHRVSFHVALNLKRSRRRPMDLQRLNPKADGEESGDVDRLHEEIARLDPELRAVVVEHYFEHRTLEQIAEHRGSSTVAVWKKVEKARERLRVALSGALGAGTLAWLSATLEAQVSVPAPPDLLSPTLLAKAGRSAPPTCIRLWLGAVAAGVLGVAALIRAGVPPTAAERPDAPAARDVAVAVNSIPAAPAHALAPMPKQDPTLPAGALARLGGSGIRHALAVTGVGFSPDGSKIASCGGKEMSLWDLAAGRELRRVQGDDRIVDCVAFSPDGKLMAYAGNDHRIRLGSLDGAPSLLRGHVHHVFGLAFFPDGKALASVSADKTVRIWDVASGKQTKVLEGHTDGVHSVAVSPDGWRVATRSQDQTVRVWNASTGEPLLRIPVEDRSTYALQVVFSPDGRAVVFHDAGRIRFIDPQDGREIVAPLEDEDPPQTVDGLKKQWNAPIRSLVFSSSGEFLASGRTSGVVCIWHVSTRTLKLRFTAPPLHSLAWSPDGALLAAGGDRSVTFWDAATGKRRGVPGVHEESVLALAVSPAGNSLASVGAEGNLQIWDLTTGGSRHRTSVPLLNSFAQSPLLAYSPQGDRLAFAGHLTLEIRGLAEGAAVEEVPLAELLPAPRDPNNRRFIERIVDGKPVREELPAGLASRVPGGMTKDASLIALAQSRSHTRGAPSVRLAVLEIHSRKEIASKEIAGNVHLRCVAFAPDQRSLAISFEETLWDDAGNPSSRFHPVQVIDLATGRTRISLEGHDKWVQSIAFSPDGTRLATASGDHTVRTWDNVTGKGLTTMKGHKGGVAHVAWSPDGSTIASAGSDWSVKFWHADTGLLLRSTEGPGLLVDSLTFDREGGRLITGMSDGSILLWSVPRP